MAEQFVDEIYGLHCDIGRLENENKKLHSQLRMHESLRLDAKGMNETEMARRSDAFFTDRTAGRRALCNRIARLESLVMTMHDHVYDYPIENEIRMLGLGGKR